MYLNPFSWRMKCLTCFLIKVGYSLAYLDCLLNLDDHLYSRLFNRRSWSKPRKVSQGISLVSRKVNKQGDLCNEGILSHILWWKEVLANSSLILRHFSLPCTDADASVMLLLLCYLMFSENGEVQETIIHAIDPETCVFEYIRVGSKFKKWKVKHMLTTCLT